MPAGPYSDDTQWCADPDKIILETLEDVTVAFHKVSGDTHILNFMSAAVVAVLSEGPETFASATPKILNYIQLDEADCPDGIIKETILQLDEVDLIAPSRGNQ